MTNDNSMTNACPENPVDKCQIPGNIDARKVILGNEYEDDEVSFRDYRDNSFVMFCSGIRQLNEDLHKIRKTDVEDVVCRSMGKCEVYEE